MKRKKIISLLLSVIILSAAAVTGINAHVIRYSESFIEDNFEKDEFDAILVLGCGVLPNGNPS